MASSAKSLSKMEEVLALIPGSRWKKMFGGVGVYYDEKFVAVFDDDMFFVKPSSGWDGGGFEEAPPYPGASMYWLIPEKVWHDPDKLHPILEKTAAALPAPRAKKTRSR